MTHPTPVVQGQDDPTRLDFIVRKGEDWRLDLGWQNSDGTDHDPTGETMTIEWDSSSMSGTFPATVEAELSAGSIVAGISRDTTATYDFVSIAHKIHLMDSSGHRRLWAFGRTRLEER